MIIYYGRRHCVCNKEASCTVVGLHIRILREGHRAKYLDFIKKKCVE